VTSLKTRVEKLEVSQTDAMPAEKIFIVKRAGVEAMSRPQLQV